MREVRARRERRRSDGADEQRRERGRTLDKDLHAAAQAKDEVEGRLLLDVVVREGAAVLELLAGKDEALLVGRDALLVLDLGLDLLRARASQRGSLCEERVRERARGTHVVDRVGRLDLERDRLAGEGCGRGASEREEGV